MRILIRVCMRQNSNRGMTVVERIDYEIVRWRVDKILNAALFSIVFVPDQCLSIFFENLQYFVLEWKVAAVNSTG